MMPALIFGVLVLGLLVRLWQYNTVQATITRNSQESVFVLKYIEKAR
jgi:hypothetical protein